MDNLMLVDNLTKTRNESFSPLKNQRGSAAVDYALILVFTVLAMLAVILALGSEDGKVAVIFEATGKVVGNFGSIPKE